MIDWIGKAIRWRKKNVQYMMGSEPTGRLEGFNSGGFFIEGDKFIPFCDIEYIALLKGEKK